MVGRAVTMKRPDSPGEVVTSTCPTEMPKSSLQLAKSAQIGLRALHAGHHGAKLKNISAQEVIDTQWTYTLHKIFTVL